MTVMVVVVVVMVMMTMVAAATTLILVTTMVMSMAILQCCSYCSLRVALRQAPSDGNVEASQSRLGSDEALSFARLK
jgi:hypothetical protein